MFASQFVEPKKTLSATIMHGMKIWGTIQYNPENCPENYPKNCTYKGIKKYS